MFHVNNGPAQQGYPKRKKMEKNEAKILVTRMAILSVLSVGSF
jgi:hypothetical protein